MNDRVLPSLSIIVPCFNEAATIDTVLLRLLNHSAGLTGEIIVVDDGSSDQSVEIVQSHIAKQSDDAPLQLRLLQHDRNQGKGAGLRTGFAAATCDVVIVQDADLEYNPNDIPDLLLPFVEANAVAVYGSRFVGDKYHRTQYFSHYVANRTLTLISNIFTSLNLTDIYTGYKAIARDTAQRLDLRDNGFSVEQEITLKLAKLKVPIFEVGITYAGRTFAEGKKIHWSDAFKGLRAIWRYWGWRG